MNQDFENILNDPMARNHGHLSPRCGMRLSFRNNRESNMADKTRAFLVDYAQLDNVSRLQKIQEKEAVRGGENNQAAENQTCKSIFRVHPES